MKRSHAFLLLILLGWACSPAPSRQAAVETDLHGLRTDFSSPSLEQSWRVTTLQADAPVDTLTSFPEGHLAATMPGLLKSPRFDVQPLTYYRLSFQAQASQKALWAATFFDKDGNTLLADVYSSFEAAADPQRHVFYFQAKARAAQAEFWLRPMEEEATVALHHLSIQPAKSKAAIRTWADSVYQAIPPLAPFDPPLENRNQFLPRSLRALQAGQSLRIVMLGNSIINDTGNSGWELLVEKSYPGADIELITSVRGGTGCWYYQEPGRVDTFVLRYEPDLLIIGGISHKNDTAAIHSVIRQVRTASDAEILLMSGPVGRQGDPRSNPDFHIPPQGDDFPLQLADLAERAGVAYFDMKTEWGKYIQASGKPYDFFLRDPVHANARGRQVLARILSAYFRRE